MSFNYPHVEFPNHIIREARKRNIKNVEDYFVWFNSIKDNRIVIINQAVFGQNKDEVNADSLQAIFYFLRANLHVRQRTMDEIQQEINRLPAHLQKIHKIPDYQLTEPSLSIIFDVAIYLGELLRQDVPNLEWVMEKDKKMVFYGQPVLVREGSAIDLCPQWLIEIMVIQLIKNNTQEDRLVELYEKWKGNFSGTQKDYLSLVKSWNKKR
jgi:hypothetical protein